MAIDDLDALKHDPKVLQVYSSYTKLKREGNHWSGLCVFHSERTPSFVVHADMLYFCHGCGAKGNIFQLVEQKEGISFRDAVAKVKELAGDNNYTAQAAKVDSVIKAVVDPNKTYLTFALSDYAKYEAALESSKEAQNWLAKRGITMTTARKLHLGFRQTIKMKPDAKDFGLIDKGWLVMPRIEGDKVVGLHYRTVAHGEKAFSRQYGMATALFNSEAIDVFDTLYVVEGEMDAAVLEQAGYRAVSIPSASSPVTPRMKDHIMQASRIMLAGDCDGGVGSEKMSKLWRELPGKAFLLQWPEGKKDANQTFLETCNGDVNTFVQKMDELTDVASRQPMKGVYSVQEVMRTGKQGSNSDRTDRLRMPWKEVDEMLIILPGDILTIFATQTGTGKTAFEMNIAAHNALKYNRTILDWQCELDTGKFTDILASHILKKNRNHLQHEDKQEAAREMGEAQYYIVHEPMMGVDEALDLMEAACARLSVDILIIDHLNFLIRSATNETAMQAAANKRLKGIAQKYKVIVIAIAQPKKADNNRRGKVVQLQDLKGSATASDDVDGVLAIHRNTVKMDDSDTPARDNLEAKTKVVLLKARNKGEGNAEADLTFLGEFATFAALDFVHTGEPE